MGDNVIIIINFTTKRTDPRRDIMLSITPKGTKNIPVNTQVALEGHLRVPVPEFPPSHTLHKPLHRQ